MVGCLLGDEGPRDAAAEGPLAGRVADATARVGVDVEGEPGRVGGGAADVVGSRVQCTRSAGTGEGAGCGGGNGAVLSTKGKNGTRGGELWLFLGGGKRSEGENGQQERAYDGAVGCRHRIGGGRDRETGTAAADPGRWVLRNVVGERAGEIGAIRRFKNGTRDGLSQSARRKRELYEPHVQRNETTMDGTF